MSVTALQVHRLHKKLDEVLGEEAAATLMELLTGDDGTSRIDEIMVRLGRVEQRLQITAASRVLAN